MAQDQVVQLTEELRRAMAGDAWHGPGLGELLSDVDARVAAVRPITGAHNIWEIVLHLTAWSREVTRRLQGGQPALPAEGDWPAVRLTSDHAWQAALRDLASAHQSLLDEVRRFPESRLDESVGANRDAPLATGVSYRQTIHGICQHDAYHGGQIALLKKAAIVLHVR